MIGVRFRAGMGLAGRGQSPRVRPLRDRPAARLGGGDAVVGRGTGEAIPARRRCAVRPATPWRYG